MSDPGRLSASEKTAGGIVVRTDAPPRGTREHRDVATVRDGTVRLSLEFGSFELGTDEGRELVRLLRRHAGELGGSPALAAADRLEEQLVRPGATHGIGEEELDALAAAAWEWLERVGPGACPERVLTLLDALRSRHAHD